jgi:concentrative nucleoside transporter, CNT family
MKRACLLTALLVLCCSAQAQDGESAAQIATHFGRGLIGLAGLVGIGWVFSSNRKSISWPLIWKAIVLQVVLALLILKVPFVATMFDFFSSVFVKLISFTSYGTEFLFGSFLEQGKMASGMMNFAFTILPTIVFFAAISSLAYYLGILQKFVHGFGWVMKKSLKLSGAESLAAAGNIFLGQTEAPLLIRPYLPAMTRSEMMCLMTGGMATIAGGVLASYISFLGGGDPAQQVLFAKHLLTASFMSAPAAILAAKMLVPEKETFDDSMVISKERIGSNALEALTNGTTDGLKLAINVGAMLLVFTALIYMANYVIGYIGGLTGLNAIIMENTGYDGLSLQFILGHLFAPVAWIIGVCREDMVLVGQLLGEKTILNEFYAYVTLGDMKNNGLFAEQRSIIMATYILCGFANFASIGIQIGGIGALVPNRKGLLSELGVKALIGGTLACLFTATVVGMLI